MQAIFITAKTGNGKSVLMLAPVIAHHLRRKPHIIIVDYLTEALTSDQASELFVSQCPDAYWT